MGAVKRLLRVADIARLAGVHRSSVRKAATDPEESALPRLKPCAVIEYQGSDCFLFDPGEAQGWCERVLELKREARERGYDFRAFTGVLSRRGAGSLRAKATKTAKRGAKKTRTTKKKATA